ncbi:PREDICTED: probable mediator of RNA polymerase II transcription subunit 26c [Lupinus angustifolius]|uniref:probable mediator of RNA polymerase II transcription subunit 26c n=1 Tax=Lupinus angustifolius TaxID=3871 RepID=UPI00092F3DBA|nr:PREDICTED: probable mediator of RNA polymerase II transcription subunit 26c [Lupinus angustifolius]
MDLDNYRSILDNASVDIWLLIDAALAVASVDYTDEFKRRREGIVERIYTTTSASPPCRNCVANNNAETEKIVEEELNPHGGLFNDDENKKKILEIKQQLEYTNQVF